MGILTVTRSGSSEPNGKAGEGKAHAGKQVGSVVGSGEGTCRGDPKTCFQILLLTHYVILDKSFNLLLPRLFLLKRGIISHFTRVS